MNNKLLRDVKYSLINTYDVVKKLYRQVPLTEQQHLALILQNIKEAVEQTEFVEEYNKEAKRKEKNLYKEEQEN
jgi:hypothetical protein